MDKIKVLLVEDELTLLMIIQETLEEKGEFIVYTAKNGNEGLQKYHSLHPDVIVADVMMPQMDGFEMATQIRESDRKIPILFLTARSSVDDVITGFKLGGNDYLKKPFGMGELIIRIKSLVNTAFIKVEESNHYKLGNYTFDSITQNLYQANGKITLSNRESELLKCLCENKNQVLHSLHVFISKLRQKLAQDPAIYILNVRGVGYKLIEEK